jgi:hypothetical protein
LAPAYYHQGLAHKDSGEKEKAIADFRRHLELATDPDSRVNAAKHLIELTGK